jgi:hypothetical protein
MLLASFRYLEPCLTYIGLVEDGGKVITSSEWAQLWRRTALAEALIGLLKQIASACAAQVYSLCASVTAVYLPFFVFGRVLPRPD